MQRSLLDWLARAPPGALPAASATKRATETPSTPVLTPARESSSRGGSNELKESHGDVLDAEAEVGTAKKAGGGEKAKRRRGETRTTEGAVETTGQASEGVKLTDENRQPETSSSSMLPLTSVSTSSPASASVPYSSAPPTPASSTTALPDSSASPAVAAPDAGVDLDADDADRDSQDDYEQVRLRNIEANNRILAELGLLGAGRSVQAPAPKPKPAAKRAWRAVVDADVAGDQAGAPRYGGHERRRGQGQGRGSRSLYNLFTDGPARACSVAPTLKRPAAVTATALATM